MRNIAFTSAICALTAIGLTGDVSAQPTVKRVFPARPIGNAAMPVGTPGVPVGTPAYYSFTMKSFEITDTMAVHEDTDYVSLTVTMSGHDPITNLESAGNVNNGVHQTNFAAHLYVPADPNVQITITYLIINKGHADDRFQTAVLQAMGRFSKLGGYLLADCDGVVAQGTRTYTGLQLAQQAAGKHDITWTDGFSGKPPHRICHRSNYNVRMLIRQNFPASGNPPAQ